MKKNVKRKLVTVFSIILAICVLGQTYVFALDGYISKNDTPKKNIERLVNNSLGDNSSMIIFEGDIDNNTDYYNSLFKIDKASKTTVFKDRITVEISGESLKIIPSMTNTVKGNFDGTCNHIEIGTPGYVGIFEGDLVYDERIMHTVVNAIFSNDEAFLAFTIYTNGVSNDPEMYFCGELSQNLRLISNANYEYNCVDSETELFDVASSNAIDYSVYLQQEGSIMAGSFVIGKMQVYHSNNIKNGTNQRIYTRITTTPYGAENYIHDTLGIANASLVQVNKVVTSMESNNSDLYIYTYGPSYSSNSTSLTIPIYAPGIGFQTPSLTITTSTIQPTTQRTISGCVEDNKVTWVFEHRNSGWNRNTTNYTSDTATGFGTWGEYHLGGNLTNVQTRRIDYTGQLRISYYMHAGEYDGEELSIQLSFLTNTRTMLSTINAIPDII